MRMSSVSLDLVVYDSVFAQRQVQALQGTCTSCRRESYTVKRCTRCGLARYCDRDCQRRDYRRHKGICMTISDFEAAKKRIGPDLRQVLLGPAGFTGFSFFIGSLPDITRCWSYFFFLNLK
ncbi:histone-lysine N-methyltransferase Smyd1-like [Physella acuta]|uniref:histone-lysine N-methyltransferase Smyd1-like n=1 Tax=Physella acuta TaxID=109671 RepID=UPI0027DD7119|nr:histone-lysine N-methyltransferase Smyd1-like [Physella acuta]